MECLQRRPRIINMHLFWTLWWWWSTNTQCVFRALHSMNILLISIIRTLFKSLPLPHLKATQREICFGSFDPFICCSTTSQARENYEVISSLLWNALCKLSFFCSASLITKSCVSFQPDLHKMWLKFFGLKIIKYNGGGETFL